MSVPAARLEVVNAATPSTSVALPIAPLWSLKVTVPPFGVAPPARQVADGRGERDRLPEGRRSGRGPQRREGGQGARRADGHGRRCEERGADGIIAIAVEDDVGQGRRLET